MGERRDGEGWPPWVEWAIVTSLIVLAIALTSCKAAQPSAAPPLPRAASPEPVPRRVPVDVLVVDPLTVKIMFQERPVWGVTTVGETGGHLLLYAGMEDDRALARHVAVHEVGHALGLSHEKERPCFLYPTTDRGLPHPLRPCPEEVAAAALKSADKVIVLRVHRSERHRMRESIARAAEVWNQALGREAVVLEDPP